MLPEQSVGKMNEGKVVAVGGGLRGEVSKQLATWI